MEIVHSEMGCCCDNEDDDVNALCVLCCVGGGGGWDAVVEFDSQRVGIVIASVRLWPLFSQNGAQTCSDHWLNNGQKGH